MILSGTSFEALFLYVFATLLVMAVAQSIAGIMGKTLCGWKSTFILGITSFLILLLPVGGLPVGRWLASLNSNFCIPLTAMLFSSVLEKGLHIRLFDDRDRLTAWVFGLIAGIFLYPMTLGLSRFDPYILGWQFSWFFVLLLSVTIILLIIRNRFSVVLIISVLAYDFGLFFHSPGLKPSPFRRKALARLHLCYNRSWEVSHERSLQ